MFRLELRKQDYKLLEQSQHLFDVGKRAALYDEIRWLEKIIKEIQAGVL